MASGATDGEFVIYNVFRAIAFFPRVALLTIINSTLTITNIKGKSY